MDGKLLELLDRLRANIDVLNDQLFRMIRDEECAGDAQTLRVVEHIRGACLCSIQNMHTLERLLQKTDKNMPVRDII